MAELLANSPVAGKREPIGELVAELKAGEGAGSKLKLGAAVAKATGLQETGETRVLVEAAGGSFEIVRIKTTASAWSEAEVLARAVEESTEANHAVGAKVFDVPTRAGLLAWLQGNTEARALPAGGATSTALVKKSATDYDTEWTLIANA